MQKKSNVFTVSKNTTAKVTINRVTVEDGLEKVLQQAEVEGLRPVTIRDYKKWYSDYTEFNRFEHLDQFTADSIYRWLNSMDVANSTKRIRLKALKAVLGRLFNSGLLKENFFRNITIKVDEDIKEGATEEDIMELLSHLDMTNFFHLRDACAVLLMWQTGIRIHTLSQLTESHIDFEEGLMICTGNIMKNRRRLVLPLSEQVLELLSVLIEQNKIIREEFGFNSDWIFMTKTGRSFVSETSCNVLGNRLSDYSKQYGIKNINPHAIRRGFAKRLLDNGTSVPVISKALGHSSIAVTTKYLNISEAELINEVKRLL